MYNNNRFLFITVLTILLSMGILSVFGQGFDFASKVKSSIANVQKEADKDPDTFKENIPAAAKLFLEKMPVVFAVGVVQNAYDEISDIRVFSHDEIVEGDREMLRIAKARFPRFKFDDIDLLIIDRIGKDISGEGADPNVTGRGFMPYFKDDFHTKKLFIRGLSEQSHSNACGLGLADITTRRCLNSVDWESTWINLTTNLMIDGGKIPLYQNNDYDAIRVALKSCPRIDFKRAKIARIRDTLSLSEFEVSAALAEELNGSPKTEFPSHTALGSLGKHVSTPNSDFQPMNCTFGLIDPLPYTPGQKRIRKKQERYEAIAARALETIREISNRSGGK